MSDLGAACQDLAGWLAIAETLAAIPDIQPSARPAGRPGTRIPGNAAVLHAIMDAHAGVRELEAELRLTVAGTALERGGSDANTAAALEAIPAMELAADSPRVREGVRRLSRWALAIQQLPAVDTAPRWIPIRAGPDGLPPRCPWCQTFSLRLSVESGEIRCVFPGCTDDDGRRPQARLEVSRVDDRPILAWKSGLVQ